MRGAARWKKIIRGQGARRGSQIILRRRVGAFPDGAAQGEYSPGDDQRGTER